MAIRRVSSLNTESTRQCRATMLHRAEAKRSPQLGGWA